MNRGLAVLLLCSSALLLADSAAVPLQLNPTAEDGPIQLYLMAAYGRGLKAPASAPELIAYKVTSKSDMCQQKNAVTTGRLGGAGAAAVAAVAADPPAEALCSSKPLTSGLYTLLAARVDTANWATWKCYARPLDHGGAAPAAAAGDLPMFSTQSVQLVAGNSYTCVATYTRLTRAQKAAMTSINWSAKVAQASTMSLLDAQVSAASATGQPGDDANAAAAPAAACSAPTYQQPPRGKPPSALKVAGYKILDTVTNRAVNIRGLNWFGFNVKMGMVDGLWAGGTEAATDFGTIAYQISMLGYNAVRLPFIHTSLANTEVWDLVRECADVSPQQLKTRLVDPQNSMQAANKKLPENPAPLANNPPTMCNTYLPTTINRDRLLFVLQAFVAQGLYVILDYQPMGLEQHPYNLNQFVGAWLDLWKQVTCLPNFESDLAGRVLVDVMNEPDSMNIRWEPQGDRPGAEQLYLATADAIWAQSPGKVLFMFEGTGQNMFGLNWGNGFITDKQVISSRGLSDPNSFFTALVQKPYSGQAAIISPHVYPPTITGATFLGKDLWAQSTTSFGYLQQIGYCQPFGRNRRAACFPFPVLIGETGSAYKTETDKQWLNDFSDYVYGQGAAAMFNNLPLSGWLWWAYNENSGDTGGIVMNQWQDLHWEKLRFMMAKMNLQPWYMQASTAGVPPRRRRRKTGPHASNGPEVEGPVEIPVPAAGGGAAATPAASVVEAPTVPATNSPEQQQPGGSEEYDYEP